jgi:hypothetical protein
VGVGLRAGRLAVRWTRSRQLASAYTNFDGTYRLPLEEGSYKLRFSRYEYAEEWWDDAESFEAATNVVVTASGAVANASMLPLIPVSGRVTVDGSPGTPVPYTQVWFWQGDSVVATGYSFIDGTYSVFVKPGTYEVEFRSSTHQSEWFDDQLTRAAATTVDIIAPRTDLDAALAALPQITGTVVDDDGGAPIAGVFVYARFGSGSVAASAVTDALGAYTMAVPPAEFVLEFDGRTQGYVREYFSDQSSLDSAALIDVRSGGQIANASLARGGSISGTLLGGDGLPASGCAFAYPAGDVFASWSGYDCTGSDGVYQIDGLAPGSYLVVWYGATAVWFDGSTDSVLGDAGCGVGGLHHDRHRSLGTVRGEDDVRNCRGRVRRSDLERDRAGLRTSVPLDADRE